MIKLAFSTNAFKRYSLEDSIREIARVGYSGVEILCDIPHAYAPTFKDDQVRSLKKTLALSNMQISNLNAFTLYAIGDTYHPSWIDDSREVRIEHTIECIRLAKRIGAKHLSTEPGGPVAPLPSSQQQQHQDISRLEKIFLDGLTRVAKMAEEEDIKVLIEPEPGLLIENSRQFKNFVTKNINSKYFRLNFDIGHFYCVNEDPAKVVYELSDYIEHFHLADIAHTRIHNHLIPGKGSIDFRSVFDAMDDIGYRGFVTVELYPYQDNPIYAAKEAYSYLCSIM
ncbi:MAG TPA: sugar phosphate isomerase/epimerase family protein [Nitrososphaera sp.]|jgi:sugar phosphate isomerase/epimerase|nr:sugar phosphate isomerase/epimerase family protein [Nitrososphaera sp.]